MLVVVKRIGWTVEILNSVDREKLYEWYFDVQSKGHSVFMVWDDYDYYEDKRCPCFFSEVTVVTPHDLNRLIKGDKLLVRDSKDILLYSVIITDGSYETSQRQEKDSPPVPYFKQKDAYWYSRAEKSFYRVNRRNWKYYSKTQYK